MCKAPCLALRNALNQCKLALLRVVLSERLAKHPARLESGSVWGGGAWGHPEELPEEGVLAG